MSLNRELLPDPEVYYEGQGLKLVGTKGSQWKRTRCEFHGSTKNTLGIFMPTGGFHCWSCGESGGDVLAYHIKMTGQDFVTAAKSFGAWVDDGKSPQYTPKPKSLPPREALGVLNTEALVVVLLASDVAKGKALDEKARGRLLEAAGCIHRLAVEYAQ